MVCLVDADGVRPTNLLASGNLKRRRAVAKLSEKTQGAYADLLVRRPRLGFGS